MMAKYGLKYLCEYRSKMRGRLIYRIEIEERDAAARTDATALRMRPYSDVFSIKWGSPDDPEYAAVKGSSLTLKILCVDDMEYLSLFSVDPLKYRITIYEYRTDASGREQKLMLWRGFLSAGSYKEAFARPPYVVTLSATDGFALLDSMPFRDASGAKFSGRVSLSSLLSSCAEILGIGLPVSEWVNVGGVEGIGQSLADVFVDQTRIYDMDEDISWKSVLELAVKPFLGQFFQAAGAIHVRRIGSLSGTFRPDSFGSNDRLLGRSRPLSLPLWEDRCDIRNSAELELCAPYRNVKVSVDNSRATDSNRKYYNADLWEKTIYPTKYFFDDRIVFGANSAVFSQRMTLPVFYPASKANVEMSIGVSNLLTEHRIKAYVVVHARIDGVVWRWYNDKQIWGDRFGGYPFEEIDAAQGSAITEYYDEKYVSPYTTPSQLPGHDFKINVTNIPSNSDGSPCEFSLFIGAEDASDFDRANSHWIMVSNIEIRTSEGDEREDLFSKSIAMTGGNVDDCEIDVPVRDGGYRLNMGNILVCPILGNDSLPIVSWLAPTERGDLLHMDGEEIMRLRSAVRHQISGELRCQQGVDMNSLFEDGKFTRAIYYLNSLELLAARQVCKVQMRELESLDRRIQAGELALIHTFEEPVELACSLYGSLFFRTGAGPYGVAIYNAENGELMRLPYSSDALSIRKGLSAVVIQVSATELYAVDNLGGVLSRLDAGPSSVLNFSTALYDGDRHSWVSYAADTAKSKTDITIFTRNMELESKDTMDMVASGMVLISNGYVLLTAEGPSWWHNYELHPSERIERSAYDVAAVSDSLLVATTGEEAQPSFEVRLRSGQLLGADKVLSVESIPPVTRLVVPEVMCNCAIVAVCVLGVAQSSFVRYYDSRTGRSGILKSATAKSAALAGDRIFIMDGADLVGFRVPEGYRISLNGHIGTLQLGVSAKGGDLPDVEVETDGTPYIDSCDSRIVSDIKANGDVWSVSLSVPGNQSEEQIVYEPVVVSIRENPMLTRRIVVTQRPRRSVVFDGSKATNTQDILKGEISLARPSGTVSGGPLGIGLTFQSGYVFKCPFSQIEGLLQIGNLEAEAGNMLSVTASSAIGRPGTFVGSARIPAEGDVVIILEKK